MRHTFKRQLSAALLGTAIAAAATPAAAYNLINEDGTELNFDLEMILGYFNSQESYGNPNSKPSWTEGYAKYGLSGSTAISDNTAVFGGVNVLTSFATGDGEASGTTNGDERQTKVEDLYAGFRTGNIEISAGRQNITLGDGFILNGDSLNFGEAIDKELSRGGAYWLAGRKAFDKTVMVKVGGDDGLRSDIFWFESDNKAQGRPEMAGVNLEYVTDTGTYGAMYLKGLDSNPTGIAGGAFDNLQRDGQRTVTLRYQGNAGVENLFLSAEYANQSSGNNTPDGNAWYAEAGWTFADTTWSPTLTYRYSTFDEHYDQLFTGFNRGYGTWFQGEVWANYAAAGPGNTGVDIHHVGVKANPSELLTVGALFFNFDNTSNHPARTDAQEFNVYAEWVANDHLIISPLLGFFKPDAANGPQGNTDTNTYFQVLAIVPF